MFRAGATGGSEAMGKSEFLRLLVTQMTNQDPLEPMEDTAFVAQLAQFSSLEQLMGIGDGIGSLAIAQSASNAADTVGFIGKEIVAVGESVTLRDGEGAALGVNTTQPADSVTITIYDEAGTPVRTIVRQRLDRGAHIEEWDGTDHNGRRLPPGNYRFEVEALGDGGAPIPSEGLIKGRVDGVTFERGYPELKMGSSRITLGDVRIVNG